MISDILKLREISGGFKPGQPDRQCYHLISLGKNIPIYQPYASPALKTQVISDVNCYEIQNHPAPPKRMVEPLNPCKSWNNQASTGAGFLPFTWGMSSSAAGDVANDG